MVIGIPGGGGFRPGGFGRTRSSGSGPLPRFRNIDRQQGLSILANGISQACREAALSLCFSQQSTYMTFRTVSAHPTYGDIFVQYQESFGIVANANSFNLDHITFNRGISQADVLHILNSIPQAQNSQDLRRLDAYGAGAVAFADQAQTAAPTANPLFAQIAAETDPGRLERLGSDALGRGKNDIFTATLRRRVELSHGDQRLQRTLVTNLLQQQNISPEETAEIRSLLLDIAARADSKTWLQNTYDSILKQANVPSSLKQLLVELSSGQSQQTKTVTHSFIGSTSPVAQQPGDPTESAEFLINAIGLLRKKIKALQADLAKTRSPANKTAIKQDLFNQATKLEGIIKQLRANKSRDADLQTSIAAVIKTAEDLIRQIKPESTSIWR